MSNGPLVIGQIGFAVVARSIFVALLTAAAVVDMRTRRIPNSLSLTLAVCGVAAGVLGLGWATGPLMAAGSLLVGFLLWLPFYALGAIGAGDVKLFAAAAAWLTPGGACWAALAAALVGALVGLATYVWSHGLSMTAFRLGGAVREPRSLAYPMPSARGRDARVPYGVSLVAGVLVQAFAPAWHAWVG